jgi:hypothetical protein
VPLEGFCNAALSDAQQGLPVDAASLPARGETVLLHDIPFRLPPALRGADHLDLGGSLFHYRNQPGGFMADLTWPPPSEQDNARLRLTVPNRPWQRLWLLAATDDQPHSVPVVTARFYRPSAGLAIDAQATVPTLTGKGGDLRSIPVKLTDGQRGKLWLVPIELDSTAIAAQLREQPVLCVELTKQVYPYRNTPDPCNYNWFQGGLPSGVHVLAVTLEEAPLKLLAAGNRTGNVYVLPERPVWQVALENRTRDEAELTVKVTLTDPQGQPQELTRELTLPAAASLRLDLPLVPATTGLHQVVTEVTMGGRPRRVFTSRATLTQLPPDTRQATSANTRWGLWTWAGGHGTNDNLAEISYLNLAAGAHFMRTSLEQTRRSWDVRNGPAHLWVHNPEPWASEKPIDPAKYADCKERFGKSAAKSYAEAPDTPCFALFTETAISERVTYGVPLQYLGEKELVMTPEEQARFDAFMIMGKAVCEGIREHAPKAKIALGWCEPAFTIPFLKAGFPKELFDYIGVDSPTFERVPELPIREVSPNRMWLLKEAMRQYGYEDKPIIHTESYYPPSHPLALGLRGAADHTVRLAVLSLALGSDYLANCFTLDDPSGYWGSQHYGGGGLLGPRPEYLPKPSYPAFATMTRLLDLEQYDGFVPTGSASAYAVRFRLGARLTYCLWTVRGSRPATLTFTPGKGAPPVLIDESGRATPLALAENAVTVALTGTPCWIRTEQPITTVTLGEPTYADRPGLLVGLAKPHVVPLDDLRQPWTSDPAPDEAFAQNHWGAPRYPGTLAVSAAASATRGRPVTRIDLAPPAVERPLAAWYGTLLPPRPLPIPGQARALGVWANGHSTWGRLVYEVTDAKGEVWRSIGKRDDWNCDDIHGWSYFAHDGWRYLEFPLPSNLPGDQYRDADSVWWNHTAEGVVDLPLTLTRVFIEARTHVLYVDALQPLADRSVELADLVAVYPDATAAGEAPVRLQQATAALPLYRVDQRQLLDNPIAELRARSAAPPAPTLTSVAPPAQGNDGTRLEVAIAPVEGATAYKVYVAANADGAGAKALATGATPTLQVTGLRPDLPLYLFATYTKDQQESQPSPARQVLIKDQFPMK